MVPAGNGRRERRTEKENIKSKGLHGMTVREISREVTTQVYLDSLYKKKGSHIEFQCPSCTSCITKINIIRSEELEHRPQIIVPHYPDQLDERFGRKPRNNNVYGIHGAADAPMAEIPVLQVPMAAQGVRMWEILKSIVYGGLTQSIVSLGIVSSAVGAGLATLNIIILALANLLGALFIIGHNFWELRYDRYSSLAVQTSEEIIDRYQEVLGRRENFFLHATAAILSYFAFGLVPPLVYGFSFPHNDSKNKKLEAVAITSLLCIALLGLTKAHMRKPRKYIKTLLYYVVLGFGSSGVSYMAGNLIGELVVKLGWFQSTEAITLPISMLDTVKPVKLLLFSKT